MKIVLAEERNGGQLSEQSFNKEQIRVGRDPVDCDIAFDSAAFPMVSRHHAELRLSQGQWVLQDLNSSYGTFVDGQKIAQPRVVQVGNRIQFGAQGPILRVIWFEVLATPPPNFAQPSIQPAPILVHTPIISPLPPTNLPSQNKPHQPSGTQTAQLDFVSGHASSTPFRLTKDSIWLGRDPNGEVVFEASAVMVSRKHAEIRRENNNFIVHDNGSFNGTLVNQQRISAPTPLYHNDEIQLGLGGPVVRFNAPSRVDPMGLSLAGQRSIAVGLLAELQGTLVNAGSKTMAVKIDSVAPRTQSRESAQPQLLMSLTFGSKQELTIGRADKSDIKIDGLQISNRHARLVNSNSGIVIEDLNSTNGVYINGNRISRQVITPNDAVQIGSFLIKIDDAGNIGVFDTRSKTRIDSVNITKDVKNRSGGGTLRLLDNVSLSVQPNEFIGLLGPSGAGKSTLMDAMNGMRPASSGSVLINNLDLYQHL
ncbi:MAG: FHA domain-containing protein, partial [Acidobacteriota bacterium]|nr:FHA domain-containing protein [Acidobacteriota bacterium]